LQTRDVFPIHQEGAEMVRSSDQPAGVTGEWECMECGYVEAGIEGRRPKKCLECDAPASALEFFSDEEDVILDRSVGAEYDDETDEEETEEDNEDEETEGESIYR
jgi:hypothetical protein